nr:MAG TPA: hypothetical protein [Caudoviricetes sp.]
MNYNNKKICNSEKKLQIFLIFLNLGIYIL